jgi:hypothetical protein
MRVQQVRNMGVIEGNKEVTPQKWEEVKGKGDAAVEKWIDDNMKNKSCVVVLIGEDTANRPWVEHEMLKAYKEGKGLVGVYIHNLKCPRTGTSTKGSNPFDKLSWSDNGEKVSKYVKCHNPKSTDAYNDISNNISQWIEDAINDVPNRR